MVATWEGRLAEERRAASERQRELSDERANAQERAAAQQRAAEGGRAAGCRGRWGPEGGERWGAEGANAQDRAAAQQWAAEGGGSGVQEKIGPRGRRRRCGQRKMGKRLGAGAVGWIGRTGKRVRHGMQRTLFQPCGQPPSPFYIQLSIFTSRCSGRKNVPYRACPHLPFLPLLPFLPPWLWLSSGELHTALLSRFAGSPRHDLGAFYAAGLVSPQLLLSGTPKVSTFQVSKLGAVARALFCTAEDGHVNPSTKTRFRPTTSRLWS